MARLDDALKVRLESNVKRELEQRAEKVDRSAGALARRYIIEGLARDERKRTRPDES